ncbi:hypothetical protein ACWGQ2_04210 [Arthrobacter sp. NPDC055585]
MSQEQNTSPEPDAPSTDGAAAGAGSGNAVPPEAGSTQTGTSPVTGKRRPRRSTSAPTRLRQAAELLHTAPAAAPEPSRGSGSESETAAGADRPSDGGPGGRHTGGHPAADTPDTRTGTNPPSGAGPGRRGTGILPQTAGEDDPRAWGDSPEDTSAWLREQRPPHWG